MSATLTVDELVALIQHSDLPTVLVEGINDVAFYRKLESFLGTTNANFLKCGGRLALLEIYQRRASFADKRVCFVADKDMWIFTGVPEEYEDIVLTEGYCIENDFYSDADIERLLQGDERTNYSTLIHSLTRWFACEVEKHLSNRTWRITPPNLFLLIPVTGFTCCPNALAQLDFTEPSQSLHQDLVTNYKMKIQGKLLFKLLARMFNVPNRPKHTQEGLIEISLHFSENGTLTTKLIKSIASKLGIQSDDQLDLFAV